MKNGTSGLLIMAANSITPSEPPPTATLKALAAADLLIFEEHRPARQALKHAGLHRPYLKLSEHQEAATLHAVKDALCQGKTVVYMSDQGTPVLADPGQLLLELAYSQGAKVSVVAGPSSVSAAIAGCPFINSEFYFAGFLPRKSVERKAKLQELKALRVPVVLLDTPYRLKALVNDCCEVWAKNAWATLALDIAGENEQFLYQTLSKINKLADSFPKKLNFVLVLPSGNKNTLP